MNHLVITGGSKGLGADISKKFLDKGWRVTSGSRFSHLSELDKNINYSYEEVDVRNRDSVHEFLKLTVSKHGQIDCFINNAGFSEWRPLEAITEDFLLDMFQTNLMGYFWGSQAAAKFLRARGTIVNISSLAARRGTPNNSSYSASKFGVTGLTQSLAKELGPSGFRVNSVCPVLVSTNGLIGALGSTHSPAKGNPEDFLNKFAMDQTALGFLPTGEDVANLCFFLASPEARAITGQSISVDSGVLPN
jgi:NAD(P)-dependent dehydrogenase (short-subunit alcohol dehydrogenase family)